MVAGPKTEVLAPPICTCMSRPPTRLSTLRLRRRLPFHWPPGRRTRFRLQDGRHVTTFTCENGRLVTLAPQLTTWTCARCWPTSLLSLHCKCCRAELRKP